MMATAAGMSNKALIACCLYSLGAYAESPRVSPRSFHGLSASGSWRLKLDQHQDVELLGAGSRSEGVQAGWEPVLELVGTHSRRLRRCRASPYPSEVGSPFAGSAREERER
jgi:hypothetical protein